LLKVFQPPFDFIAWTVLLVLVLQQIFNFYLIYIKNMVKNIFFYKKKKSYKYTTTPTHKIKLMKSCYYRKTTLFISNSIIKYIQFRMILFRKYFSFKLKSFLPTQFLYNEIIWDFHDLSLLIFFQNLYQSCKKKHHKWPPFIFFHKRVNVYYSFIN